MEKDVKIQMLYSDTHFPSRGSAQSAGYDLYAHIPDNGTVEIKPGEMVKIGVGFATALPEGTFGAIFARSGLSTKQGLRPANCVAVIDADYRGEWIVALYNDSNETRVVNNQDRIAQMVLMPYCAINFITTGDLDETERGDGGFGSTGVSINE